MGVYGGFFREPFKFQVRGGSMGVYGGFFPNVWELIGKGGVDGRLRRLFHRASEFSGVRGRDGAGRRTLQTPLRTAGRWGWTADFRKKPTFSVSDTGGSRV